MPSVNKVILLGNLGADPELKYMPSGVAVCNIRVATTRTWKNKEGEKQEETEWSSVVFYDRLAEIVGEYVSKGDPLYVEGRLKTRKWQDKEGADRYTTEIVAESMQLLGSRRDRDGGGQQEQQAPAQRQAPQQSRNGYAQERGRPQQSSAPRTQQRPSQDPATRFDSMDDEIPF